MEPSSARIKTSYRPESTFRPIYTGGKVDITKDGRYIATTRNGEAIITDLILAKEVARTKSDTEDLTSIAWSHQTLITFSRSNNMKFYSLDKQEGPYLAPIRVVAKSHDAPVLVSASESSTGAFIASGSADGIVKVWDVKRGYITHVFRGHGGPVSSICWRKIGNSIELITGSTDTQIRIWDLNATASNNSAKSTPKPKHVLQGHVSIVRGLSLTSDQQTLLSGGRDRVVLKWSLSGKSPKLQRTITTLNSIESVGILDDDEVFFTAGDGGLKTWSIDDGSLIKDYGGGVVKSTRVENNDDDDGVGGLADALLIPSAIVTIGHDQIITFHSLSDADDVHIIGYPDQIISSCYVSNDDVAVATNSPSIFIINSQRLPFVKQIIDGHTDTILSVKAIPSKELLLSGSKDGSVRIWKRFNGRFKCIAIGSGHGEAVGAIAIAPRSNAFAISASQDRMIKLWDLAGMEEVEENDEPISISSYITQRIHDKDINSLDISPDDKLLASGSQDRTSKVFDIQFDGKSKRSSINLKATLKAHKRGVWSAKFSDFDRVLATAGGDRSVKIWSLKDFSCIKTLEGHSNSVLDIGFLANGQQLMTSAADGLLKLWNLKTEECVATLDGHEDKVWALDLSPDNTYCVSGGGDSLLTFWKDSTEIVETEKVAEREHVVMREQDFSNYVQLKDYKAAISLAIEMNQPRRLYQLFSTVNDESDGKSITGHVAVDGAIKELDSNDLRKLFVHIRSWNANNKTSPVAQRVLHALLKLKSSIEIRKSFEEARQSDLDKVADPSIDPNTGEFVPHTIQADESNKRKVKSADESASLKEIIEGLIPYTERHFLRADRMVMESYVVDFMLQEMDGLGELDALMDVDN
ncbi:WD40 repeat-like protein [Wallemia mellicola]|nr:WD40 repeat-like protein [Wallemia mellicola]TIC37275.1 WD40 repeat-like protein [Wallemia mellicola]